MYRFMCIAVAFILASAVVQAKQCSSGADCPNDEDPEKAVSLFQQKLQLNVFKDGDGAPDLSVANRSAEGAVSPLFQSASHATPLPLVSLMVLTCNRHSFLNLALQQILLQDYKNLEVIIVDDSPAESAGGTLRPPLKRHPSGEEGTFLWQGLAIRFLRLLQRASVGAKRDIALRAARGDFVVHWDDDDIYAPERVISQVRPLMKEQAQITALWLNYIGDLPSLTFRKVSASRFNFFGSLAYQRTMALKIGGFADVSHGEDVEFTTRALRSCHRFLGVDVSNIYMRHGGGAENTWTGDLGWMFDASTNQSVTPPVYAKQELLHEYVAAEHDSAARGACPVQQAFQADFEWLPGFPRMPKQCCASRDDEGCS